MILFNSNHHSGGAYMLGNKPLCRHMGSSDCFAICKDYRCWLLDETDFYKGECPFYISRKEVEENAKKINKRLSGKRG